jgi:hypothetical protein
MTKMTFKIFTGAMALAATLTISATAQAATVLTWTNANVGVTKSIDFNGVDDGDTVNGLSANIDYKLTSIGNSGKSWVFSYNVENTSDWPVWAANIIGFGFNVDPNISSSSATGQFNKTASGNVPDIGSREVCITTNSCAGNSWGGVGIGDVGVGTFTLNFSQAKTSVSLSDAYVRYGSVYGGGEWGGSAVGTALSSNSGTPAVPEPATWAMMLIGFFAVGSTLRSRRMVVA